jgi:hypothetical protein
MTFRVAAIAFLLAFLGPVLAIQTTQAVVPPAPASSPEPPVTPVLMTADDGKSYLVEPSETLASAMHKGALHQSQTGEEQGACVPEPLENKPEGAVACKCYELTKCEGTESRQCKRHCRKDLCQCCDI